MSAAAVLVPKSSRGTWDTSFNLHDFPKPTGREEQWRFTPVRTLREAFEGNSATGHLAQDHHLPAGVSSEVLTADHPVRTQVPAPADRPAALAHQLSGGALRVVVQANTVVAEPIRLRFAGSGESTWSHLIIDAQPGSQAKVVIEYTGGATHGELVSINAQDNAHLSVVSVQNWDDDAIHLSQHDVVVGRDATANHTAVSLGGKVVRVSVNATFTGPGGSVVLHGAYLSSAGQHLEHRSFVDHSEPHCTSNVVYRGALHGDTARTVWIGDVLIRAAAVGTDTYEINRNLLLSPGARADSVPNLEIETGQIVGAGHASTSGRFDEDHLFYLMSRGITEAEAKLMVVRGFFDDVLSVLGDQDLQDRLDAVVEAKVNAQGGLR